MASPVKGSSVSYGTSEGYDPYEDQQASASSSSEKAYNQFTSFSKFLEEGPPNPNDSMLDLIIDMLVEKAHASKVSEVVTVVKAVYEGATTFQPNDRPLLENVACRTAKVATELGLDALGTEMIVGGVPILLAEAVAFPPLAAAIPVATAALPYAYANMQALAKFAGDNSEVACHRLISNLTDTSTSADAGVDFTATSADDSPDEVEPQNPAPPEGDYQWDDDDSPEAVYTQNLAISGGDGNEWEYDNSPVAAQYDVAPEGDYQWDDDDSPEAVYTQKLAIPDDDSQWDNDNAEEATYTQNLTAPNDDSQWDNDDSPEEAAYTQSIDSAYQDDNQYDDYGD